MSLVFDLGGAGSVSPDRGNYPQAYTAYACIITDIAVEEVKGYEFVKFYLSSDDVNIGKYDQISIRTNSDKMKVRMKRIAVDVVANGYMKGGREKEEAYEQANKAIGDNFDFSRLKGQPIGVAWVPSGNNNQFANPAFTMVLDGIVAYNEKEKEKREAWIKARAAYSPKSTGNETGTTGQAPDDDDLPF